MFEKVSPMHIDKVADRIAGAIVDLAYKKEDSPKVAAEVMIGHGVCYVIIESSCNFSATEITEIVERIAGKQFKLELRTVPQDKHLAENQEDGVRCGDNGIFKGVKIFEEERILSNFAKYIYKDIIASDGKYLIHDDKITICQSGIDSNLMLEKAVEYFKDYDYNITVNPLGDWSADLNNDTGLTGRKLGSDLGRGATSGAICGKDLTKADVTVNIFLYLLLNHPNKVLAFHKYEDYDLINIINLIENAKLTELEATCNIGDDRVNILDFPILFSKMIDIVKQYIYLCIGGFEKLAEWGLI